MNLEDKLIIANDFYKSLNIENPNYEVVRYDEISAHYIWIKGVRGISSLLIGDNGEYLVCSTQHGIDHHINEFKLGKRS